MISNGIRWRSVVAGDTKSFIGQQYVQLANSFLSGMALAIHCTAGLSHFLSLVVVAVVVVLRFEAEGDLH